MHRVPSSPVRELASPSSRFDVKIDYSLPPIYSYHLLLLYNIFQNFRRGVLIPVAWVLWVQAWSPPHMGGGFLQYIGQKQIVSKGRKCYNNVFGRSESGSEYHKFSPQVSTGIPRDSIFKSPLHHARESALALLADGNWLVLLVLVPGGGGGSIKQLTLVQIANNLRQPCWYYQIVASLLQRVRMIQSWYNNIVRSYNLILSTTIIPPSLLHVVKQLVPNLLCRAGNNL